MDFKDIKNKYPFLSDLDCYNLYIISKCKIRYKEIKKLKKKKKVRKRKKTLIKQKKRTPRKKRRRKKRRKQKKRQIIIYFRIAVKESWQTVK